MARAFQIFHQMFRQMFRQPFRNGLFSSGAALRNFLAAFIVLSGLPLATPAHPQAQFPGPVTVAMTDEALSAVSLPLEVGISPHRPTPSPEPWGSRQICCCPHGASNVTIG